MTDHLHDHLTLGLRRGCVACAQVEADLALSRRAALSAKQRAAGPAHGPQAERAADPAPTRR